MSGMELAGAVSLDRCSGVFAIPFHDDRVRLASLLLSAGGALPDPPSMSLIGSVTDLVCLSGLANLSLAGSEPALTQAVRDVVQQPDPPLAAVMAAMLLEPAHQTSQPYPLARVPAWLLNTYVLWRLSAPQLFQQSGEARSYSDYLGRTLDEFAAAISGPERSANASIIADMFLGYFNPTQIYFNDDHNTEFYSRRGALLEAIFLQMGLPLAHVFPSRTPRETIHVGILAASYQANAEGYFILSHLENLPRSRCSITLYYEDDCPGPFQALCFSRAERTVRIPRKNLQAVQQIRDEDLDILIVGANVTSMIAGVSTYALFRLARVQVALSASPLTTGFTNNDVFLTAALNEPPEDPQERYTEEACVMAGMSSYFAYQYDRDPQTLPISRHNLGLPEDAVVFMSATYYYKLLPELMDSWLRIMQAVPGSYLIMMPLRDGQGYYAIEPFIARVKEQCAGHGVAESRLIIHPTVPTRADVKAIIAVADIYLDSYPFAGSCSLVAPLEVGIPVVAREGRTFRSRFASTMLRFAGLDEFITQDEEAYVALAVEMALDPGKRAQARAQMAKSFADGLPYFDDSHFPAKVEASLVQLWEGYEASEDRLRRMSGPELVAAIVATAAELAGSGNQFFRALSPRTLTELGVLPGGDASGLDALTFVFTPATGESSSELADIRPGPTMAGDTASLVKLLRLLDTFRQGRHRRWTKVVSKEGASGGAA